MLTIITGKINSGKTTRMKSLYDQNKKGDGLLSVKAYEADQHIGYNLSHLKSGNQKPFIRLKNNLPEDWLPIFQVGKYSFSKSGLDFASEILTNITETPIYIDEIGPLEIHYHKGFYHSLNDLLNKDLVISLRDSLYNDFFKTFTINQLIHKITIE